MKLRRLQLTNFRQHADTSIDFAGEGLIGIVGSNEAGKSSLLEAITWILYGADAVRGAVKGIRWNRAPARRVASGTLTFEVGGRTYRLERSETSAELYQVDVPAPIAAGVAAVNAHVPKLVGMSLREFAATYMCRQKDLGRIASMGGVERRQFILDVMGLDRIDEALQACRARKNDLARERDGLAAGLGEREPLEAEAVAAADAENEAGAELARAAEAESIAGRIAERAHAAFDASARTKEAYTAASQRYELATRDVAAAEGDVARLRAEIDAGAAVEARVRGAEERLRPLAALRQEREALHGARAAAEERAAIAARLTQAEREIRRLEETRADAQEQIALYDPAAHEAGAAELRSAQEELEQRQRGRAADRAQADGEGKAAESELKKQERRIAALREAGPGGACPTCQRALAAQYAPVIESLEADAAALRSRLEQLRNRVFDLQLASDREQELEAVIDDIQPRVRHLAQLRADAQLADRNIDRLDRDLAERRAAAAALRERLTRLPEAAYSPERFAAVAAEIEALEPVERRLLQDRATLDRLATLAPQIEERENALASARAAVADAVAERDAAGFSAEAHQAAADAVWRAEQALTAALTAHATAVERRAAAGYRRERAQRALADYDARAGRLREVTTDLQRHTRAAERLNEFRTVQAASVRPELEELTSAFVQILTDGRHEAASLTEDFDVVLQEDGVPTEVVSGGTEDITALALRLAISQMIAQRAGHPLSLLILDEPFGSLDEVRRGNVLALIRRLGDTFSQVLVISHVAETRDAVDHVVEIEYDAAAGRSRITGGAAIAEAPLLAGAAA